MIRVKRVYEPPAPDDGCRVLVERLWPRGVSLKKAALDFWLRQAAPSPALRIWFAHDPAKWQEFRRRYRRETHAHQQSILHLRQLALQGNLTLVYAARDAHHNAAVALKEMLEQGAGIAESAPTRKPPAAHPHRTPPHHHNSPRHAWRS